jgi:hypothetical protein
MRRAAIAHAAGDAVEHRIVDEIAEERSTGTGP